MTAFSVELPFVLLFWLTISVGCLAALDRIRANRSQYRLHPIPVLRLQPQDTTVGSTAPPLHIADLVERGTFLEMEIGRN